LLDVRTSAGKLKLAISVKEQSDVVSGPRTVHLLHPPARPHDVSLIVTPTITTVGRLIILRRPHGILWLYKSQRKDHESERTSRETKRTKEQKNQGRTEELTEERHRRDIDTDTDRHK
jgi:hypothetical protein